MEAAKRFFEQAVAVVGHVPDQVTTDGHASYPRAVHETMGDTVQHRTNTYLNNRLEQDHRGIKPNESKSRARWRTPLPALSSHISGFANLCILSSDRTY
jgi:transposase-like protein